MYNFFISSTYTDLKDERQEVINGVLETRNFPIAMELFSASNFNQWEYIQKEIDNVDYYILIVGGKYGTIPKNEQISYTEKEFDYVCQKGIPIISFVIEDINKLPREKTESESKLNELLEKFTEKVKSGRIVKFYKNKEDLKSKVVVAIPQIIKDFKRPGWVRGALSTKNTQTAVKKNIDDAWIDISGYISSENKISKYTAPCDGTVEITIEKNYEMTLINETKKCPGRAVELTNGNKILKLSCSKNDEIKLEHNPNLNFKLISAKFYAR